MRASEDPFDFANEPGVVRQLSALQRLAYMRIKVTLPRGTLRAGARHNAERSWAGCPWACNAGAGIQPRESRRLPDPLSTVRPPIALPVGPYATQCQVQFGIPPTGVQMGVGLGRARLVAALPGQAVAPRSSLYVVGLSPGKPLHQLRQSGCCLPRAEDQVDVLEHQARAVAPHVEDRLEVRERGQVMLKIRRARCVRAEETPPAP